MRIDYFLNPENFTNSQKHQSYDYIITFFILYFYTILDNNNAIIQQFLSALA